MLSFGEGLAGSLPGGFNPTAGRFSPGAVNTKEAGFEPATVRTLEARVLPAPQLMCGQLREETGGPCQLRKERSLWAALSGLSPLWLKVNLLTEM